MHVNVTHGSSDGHWSPAWWRKMTQLTWTDSLWLSSSYSSRSAVDETSGFSVNGTAAIVRLSFVEDVKLQIFLTWFQTFLASTLNLQLKNRFTLHNDQKANWNILKKSYSAIPHDTNGFSAQVRTPRLVKWVQPFSGDAGHLVAGSATFGRWIRFCVLPTLWWMIWNKPVQDKLDCDELLRSRLSRSSELAAPWRWFPLFADIRMICTGHRQVKAIFRPPCHWLMISMIIT